MSTEIQQLLRKKLRAQRSKLNFTDQNLASTRITERLGNFSPFIESRTLGAYIAIHYEIDPSLLIKKAWQTYKLCYLPTVQEDQLIFCRYKENTPLKKNRFNILEPILSPSIATTNLELVFVPLLGFTSSGQRLGTGAGFYDRSFSFLLKQPRPPRPFLLGLAYEWQRLAFLTANPWDVPLNAVVTEKKIYLAHK